MATSNLETRTVTTRKRINRIEIENELGKPTRLIFRSGTLFNELGVEIEGVAETLILNRENENDLIPGTVITYKEMITAIWSLYNEAVKVNVEDLTPPTLPPVNV